MTASSRVLDSLTKSSIVLSVINDFHIAFPTMPPSALGPPDSDSPVSAAPVLEVLSLGSPASIEEVLGNSPCSCATASGKNTPENSSGLNVGGAALEGLFTAF